MLQLPLNVQLDDSSTFQNFFIAENQQVFSRLQTLFNNQADFIYVWGSHECGKTHLAQALCQQFDSKGLAAVYLPLSNSQLTPDILHGMSCMDLVCLDDINAIEGHSLWEDGLFDLYNNLKHEEKKLVIFGSSSPTQLEIALADLTSRLMAMEIYKLESLDDFQKVAFFQQRAANRGIDISEDVVRFILTRQSRSVKDLIELLELIDSSSIALKRKVTIPLIKKIINI